MHPAILRALQEIQYKPGWELCIKRVAAGNPSFPDRWCIYWRFWAPDAVAPSETSLQMGREWLLTEDATERDTVTTAFAAALACEEHETREAFRYRGASPFGPHGLVLS